MASVTVATGILSGETPFGDRIEVAWFGSREGIEGERLLAMKIRQLRKEGKTVVTTSLDGPAETTTRHCRAWVAYLRE